MIEKIKLNPHNPRYIKKTDFESLKKSIKDFPQMLEFRPIVYDENMIVLGGNMRLQALQSLAQEGFKIEDKYFQSAKGWSEEDKQKFIIKDNVMWGNWDWDMLANEWDEKQLTAWGLSPTWAYSNDTKGPEIAELSIAKLKPHQLSYKVHPADQIDELVESIKKNGIYRNLIIAKDNTILDGHAIVTAATKLGYERVPTVRLDIMPNSPEALKILIGSSELNKFAETNDRKLSDILKGIKDSSPEGLKGTGFDDMKLMNLLLVTRTMEEIRNMDEAAEWVGLPEYTPKGEILKIVVNFEKDADRYDFAKKLGITITEKTKYIWWPIKAKEDPSSVKFEEKKK